MVLVVRPVFQTPAEGVGFGASFTPARGTDYKCKDDPTVTLPFPTQAHANKKNDLRSYRRPLGKRQQVAADRKSVLKLSENAKENIEEPKRKSTRDERTSESPVDQRATYTSERSIDIQRSHSEDREARVALFSPEFFRNCARNLYLDDDAIYELNLVTEEVRALEIQDDPVNLKPESTSTTCPRILTANTIHQLEEPKRKSTRDEWTPESLFDPKVAYKWSIDIQRSQSTDSEASVDETSGDKLRKAVGDMSLTLFSREFFRDCARNLYLNDDDAIYELNLVTEEVSALKTQDDPVNLKPEPMSTLTACPRILTANMIHQLIEEALPMSLRTARWDRIYALGRDGDEFTTMTRNCANFKDTVILAVTSQGHILGGYASAPWVKQEGHRMSRSFYGNGESFLFASHPEEEDQHDHPAEEYQQYRKDIRNFQNLETQVTLQPENEEEKKLHIFKWTGSNAYSQYVDDGQLAMGGGGAFGLIIQDNFSRGSTGHCSTFGNPPLVPRGIFDIVNFEVYGFTSLGGTLKSEQE